MTDCDLLELDADFLHFLSIFFLVREFEFKSLNYIQFRTNIFEKLRPSILRMSRLYLLQRSDLGVTLFHLVVRLQFLGSEEYGAPVHSY